MKASPEAQLRLLELADLDTELGRLDHRRRTLPEIAELDQLAGARRQGQGRDHDPRGHRAVRPGPRAGPLRNATSNRSGSASTRTSSGSTRARCRTPGELESLQSEIASLRRRQGDLEEIVLDLMERREAAQSRRDEARRPRRDGGGRGGRGDGAPGRGPGRHRGAGESKARRCPHLGRVRRPRRAAGPVRQGARAGPAAAPPRCCAAASASGCNESLSTVELNEISAAAPDEVMRHEECRRILVRTAESGL